MSRERRKYDTKQHRLARKRFGVEVAAGRASCWRCGRWIPPGSKWHVGHDDAGVRIMGPEHAKCNLAAQNRLRAAKARAFTNGGPVELPEAQPAPESPRPQPRRHSRHWFGSEVFEEWCSECRRLQAPCGKVIVREW